MKKIPFLIWLIAAMAFTACNEIGPPIDLGSGNVALIDTTYLKATPAAPQHRVVLIEEFTGATCNNCPAGHVATNEIYLAHPDSVIIVAIHNDNPQADPYPNEEDFRTTEGIQISQRLGGSAAIPVAAIDRFEFPGETQEAVIRPKWKNYTIEELKKMPPVNIDLDVAFDAVTREILVTATMEFTSTVTTPTNLSIMITESKIISPQKLQNLSTDYDYEHNHVLRGMITPVFGVVTNAATEAGRVVIKQFKYTLPATWDENNLEVVTFVHHNGATNNVLQAAHEKVK